MAAKNQITTEKYLALVEKFDKKSKDAKKPVEVRRFYAEISDTLSDAYDEFSLGQLPKYEAKLADIRRLAETEEVLKDKTFLRDVKAAEKLLKDWNKQRDGTIQKLTRLGGMIAKGLGGLNAGLGDLFDTINSSVRAGQAFADRFGSSGVSSEESRRHYDLLSGTVDNLSTEAAPRAQGTTQASGQQGTTVVPDEKLREIASGQTQVLNKILKVSEDSKKELVEIKNILKEDQKDQDLDEQDSRLDEAETSSERLKVLRGGAYGNMPGVGIPLGGDSTPGGTPNDTPPAEGNQSFLGGLLETGTELLALKTAGNVLGGAGKRAKDLVVKSAGQVKGWFNPAAKTAAAGLGAAHVDDVVSAKPPLKVIDGGKGKVATGPTPPEPPTPPATRGNTALKIEPAPIVGDAPKPELRVVPDPIPDTIATKPGATAIDPIAMSPGSAAPKAAPSASWGSKIGGFFKGASSKVVEGLSPFLGTVKEGAKTIGKGALRVAAPVITAWDYSDRRSRGQNMLQAAAGSIAGLVGGTAGWTAGAGLGAATTGGVGSIPLGIGGAAIGANYSSKLVDYITGADQVDQANQQSAPSQDTPATPLEVDPSKKPASNISIADAQKTTPAAPNMDTGALQIKTPSNPDVTLSQNDGFIHNTDVSIANGDATIPVGNERSAYPSNANSGEPLTSLQSPSVKVSTPTTPATALEGVSATPITQPISPKTAGALAPEDTFMRAIAAAETGAVSESNPVFHERRFMRTGSGADSSAYGPLQITKSLAEGYAKNNAFDSDPELKEWVTNTYIPHGQKLLSSDYSDPKYGAFGQGDLRSEADRAMYQKMARVMASDTLRRNNGDPLKAAGEWRFGDKGKGDLLTKDPRYAQVVAMNTKRASADVSVSTPDRTSQDGNVVIERVNNKSAPASPVFPEYTAKGSSSALKYAVNVTAAKQDDFGDHLERLSVQNDVQRSQPIIVPVPMGQGGGGGGAGVSGSLGGSVSMGGGGGATNSVIGAPSNGAAESSFIAALRHSIFTI